MHEMVKLLHLYHEVNSSDFVTNAAGPTAFNKLYTMITWIWFLNPTNFPPYFQSNLPLSTITPPIVVPCPPMNFVAE